MPFGRKFPDDLQLEFCELCGERLPAARRSVGIAQGLKGRWLCPGCAPFGANLSYQDYQSENPVPVIKLPIEPHSGEDWIKENQGMSSPLIESFLAGALLTAAYSVDLPVSSALGLRAVPFVLPQGVSSHTLKSATIYSTGYSGDVQAAVYKISKPSSNHVELVKDLGTVNLPAFGSASFQTSIFLAGDAIYFVALYGTGAGTIQALAAADSDETLGAPWTSVQARPGWGPSPGWPDHTIRSDWTRLAANFFKILLTMET